MGARVQAVSRMTAAQFKAKTGKSPHRVQLVRVNCKLAGELMHLHCGWCPEHDKPRYSCLCTAPGPKEPFETWKAERNAAKRHTTRLDDIRDQEEKRK